MRLTEAQKILESAGSVLVVDWPSRDVPETLAKAGYSGSGQRWAGTGQLLGA